MPPKIEETKDILFLDGIYLGRKACVLICCDEKNVLGWYLCRYEHAGAWIALMKRIAEPRMVVSDGGTGFAKALKKVWPIAKHQRCIFHVFCQIKRYITSKPNTLAGIELYCLAKDLLKIKEKQEAETWVTRFTEWIKKYQEFLSEMTVDEHGNKRPTHSIPPTHPVHFNLFLAKIVRNLSFNKYRNKYTQKRGRGEIALVLEELEECLAGHSDVEALYIAEELQETINTFVRALPEREGNVFIRRYFYSDSIKDISVRYRMSENNIRVMLNRTRNKLRDRLEKEGYLS